MFKINNKYTTAMPRVSSIVFIVNFEHISSLVLVFLLLTLNIQLAPGKMCQFVIQVIGLYILV